MSTWNSILETLKNAVHRLVDWFQENVEDDYMDFVEDNKPLMIDAIRNTAEHYINEPDHLKFKSAVDRLGSELLKKAPEVKFKNWWLSSAIQLVFSVLKSQGKI